MAFSSSYWEFDLLRTFTAKAASFITIALIPCPSDLMMMAAVGSHLDLALMKIGQIVKTLRFAAFATR